MVNGKGLVNEGRNEQQLDTHSPWFSIWLRPRETIRGIVDSNPKKSVILLAGVGGIASLLDVAAARDLGDSFSLPTLVAFAVTGGFIVGLVELYLGGAILRWISGLLKGQASVIEVRAVIAWSSVPLIVGMILWIPEYVIFREELFTSASPTFDAWLEDLVDANSIVVIRVAFWLTVVTVIRIAIGIWSFVIEVLCLAEVNGFSSSRAFGAAFVVRLIVAFVFFVPAFFIAFIVS